MIPWWERFPGRLEQEIRSLDERGFTHRRDELAWKKGKLILHVGVPERFGGPLDLLVHYPDFFPYTRFDVFAPALALRRHQNPFGKNLCLLGRASTNWRVTDTLGGLLETQLRAILRFQREGATALRDLEEPQGEPFTDYCPYDADTAVLVDSSWHIDPAVRSGKLRLAFSTPLPFRGAVLAVSTYGDRPLAEAPSVFSQLFKNSARGSWFRMSAPVEESEPTRILGKVAVEHPKASFPKRPVTPGQAEVIGVLFPEEADQGTYIDAWIFLVHTKGRWQLARGCRAGQLDVTSRSPELRSLPSKRASLVGLGAVGSPVAVGLARHGVGLLKLLDYDFVEAGTAVRWELGLNAAGRKKAHALAAHINQEYPYTAVEPLVGAIGRAQRVPPPEYCDWRNFPSLISTDAIMDFTAEIGINFLLSDAAAENKVPYICASATPGGWGGLVFRQLPGAGEACWSCLQHAMSDGTVPTPPYDPKGELQPAGCASRTFTGAAVDLEQVSVMALRMGIATLCRGEANGYPDISWNVAVLALRTASGELIAPQWTTLKIGRHGDCFNEKAHGHDVATQRVA